MKRSLELVLATILVLSCGAVTAGGLSAGAKQAAEYIIQKFGRRVPTQSVDEVATAVSAVAAKYGDEALPFLSATGHAGFDALKQAGPKAPEVLKLHLRRGEEAVWIISKPEKLAIFIKHGDTAAEALIKHPGIADSLIAQYGDEAAGALANISRQSAQHLGMAANDGLLTATSRSPELLGVIRTFGDKAMDFVWKNKGSLALTAVLASFLADPQIYISGTASLVAPVLKSVNWTFIIGAFFLVAFLPFAVRSFVRARRELPSLKPPGSVDSRTVR